MQVVLVHRLCFIYLEYRIAGMFDVGKVWQIWQVVHDLPNFNQPKFSL